MSDERISGQTLIAWGHRPGAWFKAAIAAAEDARRAGQDEAAQRAIVAGFAPKVVPVDPHAAAWRTHLSPQHPRRE